MRTYEVRFTHRYDEGDEPTVLVSGTFSEAQTEMERLELLWGTWADVSKLRTLQRSLYGRSLIYTQENQSMSAWVVAVE